MGELATLANTVWRDYATDGVPASGRHNPDKAAIRAFYAALDARMESYEVRKHVDAYPSVSAAMADLGEGEALFGQGGKTYVWGGGQLGIPSTTNNFLIDSDNGKPWKIDFGTNADWTLGGLFNTTGSVDAATESALTKSLVYTRPVISASGSVISGATVEVVFTEEHGWTSGTEVFLQYWGSASASDAAYLTMKDSNEAMDLDFPVVVTVMDATTIRYTAPGGAPSGALGITVIGYRNTQCVTVADSSKFAVGDLVQLESDAIETGYNAIEIERLELNRIVWIMDATRVWLERGVRRDYLTTDTAKMTKVNARRPIIRNLHLKGKGYHTTPGTTADIGFWSQYTDRAIYENLFVENCNYMAYRHLHEFKPTYINCGFRHDRRDEGGKVTGDIDGNLGYGFVPCNGVMDPLYLDCYGSGGRHGFINSPTTSFRGITYNMRAFRLVITDTWSYNISTHAHYDRASFFECEVYRGAGLNIRSGNALIRNLFAKDTLYRIHAYGWCDKIDIDGVTGEGTQRHNLLIAPSGDNIPQITSMRLRRLCGLDGGTGVQIDLPDTINCRGLLIEDVDGAANYGNIVNCTNGAASQFIAPTFRRIRSTDAAFTPVSIDEMIDGLVEDVYAERAGSFTVVAVGGATSARNTFNGVRGTSTDAGTVTPITVPAGSTGNKTDSLLYELLTIAAGVATKNFRNVPLTKLETEGGAGSDDLESLLGLERGDRVILSPWDSTHDITLVQTGNLRTGWNRALTTSTDMIELVAQSTTLQTLDYGRAWQGTATYNPASLADGAGATTTVTVTGAALGDIVDVSFSLDLQGITLTAYVSAANTVSVRFQNESGGTIDLASGTITARVTKAIS